MQDPTKNLGTIGSAVLTFIGNKQTNRHPDKQSLYIEVKFDCSVIANYKPCKTAVQKSFMIFASQTLKSDWKKIKLHITYSNIY